MNIFAIRSNPLGLSALNQMALVLILSILFWALGAPTFLQNARAANVADLSDTLTDSSPLAVSNHTIEFTTPTGLMGSIGEDFDITFEAGFDISDIAFGDVDLELATVDQTIVNGAPGAGQWGVSILGQTITLTPASDVTVASSTAVLIQIGTNAAGGANQIINPAAGHYQVFIEGNMTDEGNTWVAILDSVTVTASIDTTFTFTVTAVAGAEPLFATASSTNIGSAANALTYGTLTPGTTYIAAHDLDVETNAANGFSVTIQQDQPLTSSVGAEIPEFIENAETAAPAFWVSPSGTLLDEDTWAHFGITSTDWDLNAGEFGDGSADPATGDDTYAKYVGNLNTPRVVFSHGGPADGAAQSIGAVRVGFALEVTALQPAGDYENTLMYIATPTF